MQPHEERVVTEKRELDEKLKKLEAFCYIPGSAIFEGLPREDRNLLEDQYMAMERYSQVLEKRIARFPPS